MESIYESFKRARLTVERERLERPKCQRFLLSHSEMKVADIQRRDFRYIYHWTGARFDVEENPNWKYDASIRKNPVTGFWEEKW